MGEKSRKDLAPFNFEAVLCLFLHLFSFWWKWKTPELQIEIFPLIHLNKAQLLQLASLLQHRGVAEGHLGSLHAFHDNFIEQLIQQILP